MSRSCRGRSRSSSPAGTKLNQLRFIRGNPVSTDGVLEQLAEKERLVYYENGDGPAEAVIERGLKNLVARQGGDQQAIIDRGLRTTTDFAGISARKHRGLQGQETLPARRFEQGAALTMRPTSGSRSTARDRRVLVLDPGDFYLMASKERFCVPPSYAAEMEPFDQSIGDFSVHYAGFFDPGFGYGAAGEIKGTKAVLEVRAHEVPHPAGGPADRRPAHLSPDGQRSGEALRAGDWLVLPAAGAGAQQAVQGAGNCPLRRRRNRSTSKARELLRAGDGPQNDKTRRSRLGRSRCPPPHGAHRIRAGRSRGGGIDQDFCSRLFEPPRHTADRASPEGSDAWERANGIGK